MYIVTLRYTVVVWWISVLHWCELSLSPRHSSSTSLFIKHLCLIPDPSSFDLCPLHHLPLSYSPLPSSSFPSSSSSLVLLTSPRQISVVLFRLFSFGVRFGFVLFRGWFPGSVSFSARVGLPALYRVLPGFVSRIGIVFFRGWPSGSDSSPVSSASSPVLVSRLRPSYRSLPLWSQCPGLESCLELSSIYFRLRPQPRVLMCSYGRVVPSLGLLVPSLNSMTNSLNTGAIVYTD